MGTAVKNLRVGVNCTPSSICSQCVQRRLASFSMLSQGAPLMICRKYRCACTQRFNDQFIAVFFFFDKLWVLTALWSKLVTVQASGIVTKGTESSSKCTSSRPRKYASQKPRALSQELFGFVSPCPPAIDVILIVYYSLLVYRYILTSVK